MDATGLAPAGLAAAYVPALFRVGALLAVAPPFASVAVPRRVRALLAMGLTIGLLPRASASGAAAAETTGQWIIGLAGEAMIGVAMGLALALTFAAAGIAGDLIAGQMGLSLPEAYDPRGAGGQSSPIGQAYWLLAAVVFFAANGHHALLNAMASSFDAVPVMTLANSAPAAVELLVGLMQSAMVLAIQLAAPVFAATLAADLAMGMVARTIPQLGVMTAGLTVRAIAGLVVAGAGAAATVAVLRGSLAPNWTELVRSMAGG